MKKVLLLALFACGGDDPPPPAPDSPSIARITVTAPPELEPGTAVPVTWAVEGATEADRVELWVFAPGGPLVHTTAGYQFRGAAPATAFAGMVAPDGSVSTEPIAVAEPAASGGLDVALPSSIEGDWRIEATLVRGDELLAIASSTTWVTAGGVRLEVSRNWAGTADVVRVGLHRHATTEPQRLSAWLTLPDGTVATLPGVGNQYFPVAEGVITENEHTLLARPLGTLGEGQFLVSARLEALDGEERGFASAMIQVCDQPGTIRGTVTPATAGSLDAFNVLDRRFVTTEVAADGSFELQAPPGRWLVHGMGTGGSIEVGCGETIEVALEARTAARAQSKPSGPLQVAQPVVPSVRILVVPDASQGATIDRSLLDVYLAYVRGEINRARVPGFQLLSSSDLEAFMKLERMKQLAGSEADSGAVQVIDAARTQDFTITVKLAKRADGSLDLTVRMIDLRTSQSVRAISVNGDEEGILDLIESRVGPELTRDPDELRALVDSFDNPLVSVFWTGGTPSAPGQTAEGFVHVGDTDTGKVVANGTVAITLVPEGLAPIELTATTDRDGVARFTYAIPLEAPPPRVMAKAAITRRNGQKVPGEGSPLIVQPARAAMRLEKQILRTNGDRTTTTIQMPEAAGRDATTMTSLLTVDGPSVIRFDPQGTARFEVVTGAEAGPAEVRITTVSALAGPAPQLTAVARAYVLRRLDLTAFIEPVAHAVNGQLLEIRGTVVLEGVPLPNIPIRVDTQGAGDVSTLASTNATGGYSVFYRAPAAGSGSTTIKISVVKDAELAERELTLTYEPPCANCPVAVVPDTGATVGRGGTLLLSPNQPVTWTASRGSISADGLFTAPDLGGVAVITATSVSNPANKKTFGVIVECTVQEIIDDLHPYTGDVMPLGPWLGIYNNGCLSVKLTLFETATNGLSGGVFEHRQNCAGGFGLTGGVLGFSKEGCVAQVKELAPCGVISQLTFGPDLASDGLDKRQYFSFIGQDVGTGSCRIDYISSGVLTRN